MHTNTERQFICKLLIKIKISNFLLELKDYYNSGKKFHPLWLQSGQCTTVCKILVDDVEL